MNTKTAILVAAGMCLSFGAVLGLMVAVFEPSPPARARRPVLAQRPPSPEFRRGSGAASNQPRPAAAPVRPPQASAEGPVVPRAPAEKTEAQQKLEPAAVTAEQFGIVKRELKRQIDALKKDRDEMLAELARAVAGMSPAQAAAELRALNDEAAVAVLRRLSAAQRRGILEQMSSERAQRLRRSLQAYADKRG